MKTLGFLAVLTALTSTGYSITCKSCWHFSDKPCTQPAVSCPSDNVCVAAYSVVTVVGTDTPQYSISCGTRDQCNVNGSLTFIYGKVKTGTSCCDTDDCTPPTPQLPADSSEKNGLICPTCSSDKSDFCYTGDTLPCTGDEVKCGRMARKLTGTITLKDTICGCATKSFCDILGNQVASISGLNIDSKMFCSHGEVGQYAESFYSAFAALLAKLLN
ncbi:phospholipase A2 inhibitor NAI-like [Mixophyes fleayi]|uniref:phospholipase A2 inhibitor NAI-like n=1 Tax=Mixophyes fleayi TaxID=3061075 RepID=UPI003F4DB115